MLHNGLARPRGRSACPVLCSCFVEFITAIIQGVDIETKQVVSLGETDVQTHDGEKLKSLVRKAQRRVKVKGVLGNDGYYTYDNFELLAVEDIEAGIKMRKDSNPNCDGAREEVVRVYVRDPSWWKKQIGYEERRMTETFSAGFRRLFGEVAHTKRFERMVKEIELKVWVYNLMLSLAATSALFAMES